MQTRCFEKYMKRIALQHSQYYMPHEFTNGVSPYKVLFGWPPRWTFCGPATLRPGGFEAGADEDETDASGDEEDEDGENGDEENGAAAVVVGEERGEGKGGDDEGDEGDEGDAMSRENSNARSEGEKSDEMGGIKEAGQSDGGNVVAEDEDSQERETPLQEPENGNNKNPSDDGYESAVSGKYTALERQTGRHKDHNRQLLLARQVRQNTVVFAVTEILTLKIPPKLRGQGEVMRVPVRIHSKPYDNGYVLLCKWGRLRDLALHKDLNKESLETQ